MKVLRTIKNFIKEVIQSGILTDIVVFIVFTIMSLGFYYVALFYEDASVVLILRVIATLFLVFAVKRFLLILSYNKKMAEKLERFFKGLGEFWESLQEKFRKMFPDKKGSELFRIKGYKDEVFKYYNDAGAAIKHKRLKWKELKTNSEKVRYLYADFLKKRIKKGFAFRYSDTPVQVQSKLPEEFNTNPVFDYYHEARYSGGADISDEALESIMKVKT